MVASESAFRGLIGVSRIDITPPVGIYARCWGAARHDVAAGVHRPMTLTCATFQSGESGPPLVLMALDLMTWRSREDEFAIRGAVVEAIGLDPSRLMMCLSHTHSAPGIRLEDSTKPGGDLIAPYRMKLKDAAIAAVSTALTKRQAATVGWHFGKCDLARNRDLPEPGGKRLVCGFNESGPADQTLLVARITDDESSRIIGTIVNYACHPTTLGWENQLISPDYVGAMRDTIESLTHGAPCLFLQGASGELAPAEQYVADPGVADRHGRRVGFAALGALEAVDPPGTMLAYQGVVESGAPLGVWRRQRGGSIGQHLAGTVVNVELELKKMPTAEEFEQQWRCCDDPIAKERLWRKRGVRRVVGDGATTQMPLWVWRLGNAFLVGHPNEAYSLLQTALREKFPDRALAVMNLVNGSAGYLVPRALCARDSYQTNQTPFADGSLERVIEAAERQIEIML